MLPYKACTPAVAGLGPCMVSSPLSALLLYRICIRRLCQHLLYKAPAAVLKFPWRLELPWGRIIRLA